MQKRSNHDRDRRAGKPPVSPVTNAVFIGFLVGILIYSAAKNTWGLVTLIPLYLLYRLLKK
jgi:hypothetical protein